MDSIDIVIAYFNALDAEDMNQADQYLSSDYQLVDFTPKPMDKQALFDWLKLLKEALPNLKHSLSNISAEGPVVKLTIQLCGTNSANLDLRTMGIGIVRRTRKFVIFPNATYEITLSGGKIAIEKDISPVSPNRRLPGMLKALDVELAAYS